MLKTISLKCPNCGAALEISPEMNSFACGYCGASQIVERSGGTVSLHLLTESISKVQAGTDKTAAELTIRRLKEEMEELKGSFHNLYLNKHQEVLNSKQQHSIFVFMAFAGTLMVAGIASTLTMWLIPFVLIAGTALVIAILNNRSRALKEINERYNVVQNQLNHQGREMQNRINENKKIIGY